MTDDPRVAAARYQIDKLEQSEKDAAAQSDDAADAPDDSGFAPELTAPPSRRDRASSAAERAAYVEVAIQQAIRRGEFDNLPGAGKPIPGLGESHDPDWWIRRKIESEQLTGLGPPALSLRVESAQLADRLDELRHETEVREVVEDFNLRVIEARRQLLGGPPVITPTREVDDEVRAWHARRAARQGVESNPEEGVAQPRKWWQLPRPTR
ncbi:DnaJ family domain-containing protein [Microbacterium sp. P5_E9]